MKRAAIVLGIMISVIATSCIMQNSELPEIIFERYVAREEKDDGWVFSFVYQKMKNPADEGEGFIRYQFFGINIKYLCNQQNSIELVQEDENYISRINYVPSVSVWGECSDAQKRDMGVVYDRILIQNHSIEELLNMNCDDYVFEELDGEMFFGLMRKALTGQPHKVTDDIQKMDYPIYACLQEKQFSEGYKFQVSFLNAMGIFDIVHIDILYEKDEALLSDIVRSGTCLNEQMEASAFIDRIEEAIEGTDRINPRDEYEIDGFGSIDMKRLYDMLEDISRYQYSKYMVEPRILESEAVKKQ